GSRFLAGRPEAPWITIAANRGLTAMTNVLFGSSITDMETCYKIMRTDVARSLALDANRFDIEPQITARLLRGGHRIHDAPVTFAPAGHIPSPTVPGAHVPICPAGLSIILAPFTYVGAAFTRPDAIFLVVPLFGALLVWATYRLGSRFSPDVGLASALLVACSPEFLFQLMQSMSDVPAAALWVFAAVCATSRSRRAPLMAGFATSAAI